MNMTNREEMETGLSLMAFVWGWIYLGLIVILLTSCDSWAPRRQLDRRCEIHPGAGSWHWQAATGHHHRGGCCGTLRP